MLRTCLLSHVVTLLVLLRRPQYEYSTVPQLWEFSLAWADRLITLNDAMETERTGVETRGCLVQLLWKKAADKA